MSLITANLKIFDRRQVRLHRDRAAKRFCDNDFLFREIGERIIDRLLDVKRDFPVALDLGCHIGGLSKQLMESGRINTLVQCDLSPEMARRASLNSLVADEELLPFSDQNFDLVISNLSLHWVNDLPGTLIQIRRILKRNGLFLAAFFGGGTLVELRECLTDAEIEISGGSGPRLSPLPTLSDTANLLQKTGFTMPVADSDTIMVAYSGALELMTDLRAMGESNAVISKLKSFTNRKIIERAATLYQKRFRQADNTLPATFQINYAHGWAPHTTSKAGSKPLIF